MPFPYRYTCSKALLYRYYHRSKWVCSFSWGYTVLGVIAATLSYRQDLSTTLPPPYLTELICPGSCPEEWGGSDLHLTMSISREPPWNVHGQVEPPTPSLIQPARYSQTHRVTTYPPIQPVNQSILVSQPAIQSVSIECPYTIHWFVHLIVCPCVCSFIHLFVSLLIHSLIPPFFSYFLISYSSWLVTAAYWMLC